MLKAAIEKCVHSLIHSFENYLSSVYWDTDLGTGDMVVNKTATGPAHQCIHLSCHQGYTRSLASGMENSWQKNERKERALCVGVWSKTFGGLHWDSPSICDGEENK